MRPIGSRWAAAAVALAMLGAGAAAAESVPTAPLSERHEIRLEVDVSERVLTVHGPDGAVRTYEVAVGEPDHPTPTGSFTIDRIVWNPGWVPPKAEWAEDEEEKAPNDPDNPMVGAKLFFKYPDYYVHGTHATETLGDAASHGCIRMRPADVIELARMVQTHGGAARDDAWFERVAADDGTDHEVRLPNPVPIEIRS